MRYNRPQQIDGIIMIYLLGILIASVPMFDSLNFPDYPTNLTPNIIIIVVLILLLAISFCRHRIVFYVHRVVSFAFVILCIFLAVLSIVIPAGFLLMAVAALITMIHLKCAFSPKVKDYYYQLTTRNNKPRNDNT